MHSSTTKKPSILSVLFLFFFFLFCLVCFNKGNFIMWNVHQDKFCTQSFPLFPIQPHSFKRRVPISQGCSFSASQTFCFGTSTLGNWVMKPRAVLWSHTICCFGISSQETHLAEKKETFRTSAITQADSLPLTWLKERFHIIGRCTPKSIQLMAAVKRCHKTWLT